MNSNGRLNYAFDGYVVVISPAENTSITATVDGVSTTYTSLTSFRLQKGAKLKCTYASTNSAYNAYNATNCDGSTVTMGTDVSSMYYVSTSSEKKSFSVALSATNGTVIPVSATAMYGDDIYWQATANEGYHLSGQSNSTSNASGTISNITENKTLVVANFVINQYTASISDIDYGTWSSTSSITNINHGSTISVTRGEQKSTSDTSGTNTLTVTISGASRTIETEEFSEQYYYLIYSYLPLNVYGDFNISDFIRVERYIHTASIDFSDSSTSYAGSWSDSNDRIEFVPYGTGISYSYSNQTNSSMSGNASVTITIDGYGTRTFTATDSATAQYYYTISLSATNNTAVTGSTTTKGKYINYTPAITRNTHTYSLTWNPSGDVNPGVDVTVNSSSVGSAVTSYSSTQGYGTTYSFSPKSETGYTGSLVSGSLSGTVTGDTTVSYKWTENTYVILYRNGIAEGGSLSIGTSSYNFSSSNETATQIAIQARKYTASATIGTNSGTKANYTKTGTYSVKYNRGTADSAASVPSEQRVNETWKYTASGWNTASDGTGTSYANGATVAANSTTSLTLYPKFSTARQSWGTILLATNSMAKSNTTQNGYQVKYNLGTADSTSTVPSTQTATDTISYDANGWNTASNGSGTNYADGYAYTPSADLSLYPKYTSSTTRGSVTLATNNMTRANTSGTTYTVTYYVGTANENSTVPSMQSATDTISYDANGWNTASNGSGTHYNNGATYTATANLSLYPQFSSSTTHGSVTLSTNSMRKTTTIDATYTVTYNYNGGSGSTSSGTATKTTSYTANGWTTTSGSATRTYTNGQTISLSSNLGLYPCFTPSTSTSSVTLPSSGSRTGYTLGGWNTESDASGTNYSTGASYTPTASITLYAKWSINSYTITLSKSLGSNASGYWTNSSGTKITSIPNVNYGTAISVSGNTLTVGSNTYTWNPSASSHYHVASSSISVEEDFTTMPDFAIEITGNATAAIDTFAMYFENGDYGAWYNGTVESTSPITGIAYGTTITYTKDANQSNSDTSGQVTWKVTIGNQTRTYKAPSANAQYYYGITANQSATTVTGNMTFKPDVSITTHTYTVYFSNPSYGAWGSETKTVAYGVTWSTNGTKVTFSDGQTNTVTKNSPTARTLTFAESDSGNYGSWNPTSSVSVYDYSYTTPTVNNGTGTVTGSTTIIASNSRSAVTFTNSLTTQPTNASMSGAQTWTISGTDTDGNSFSRVYTMAENTAQYYYYCTRSSSATSVTADTTFTATTNRVTHTYTLTITLNSNVSSINIEWNQGDGGNDTYTSSTTETVAYGTTIYATATAASGYQISSGTNLNNAIIMTGNLTVSASATQIQVTAPTVTSITRTANSNYTSFSVTAKNNASYAADIKYCLFSPSNSNTAIGSIGTLASSVSASGTSTKSGIYVSGYKLAYVGVKATKTNYADSAWNKYLAGIYANPTVTIANASDTTQRKVKVTVTNPNPVSATAIIYVYNSSGTSQGSTTVSIAANSSYSWTKNVSAGTYYGRAYFVGSGYVTASSYVNSSNLTPTLTTTASWHTLFSGDYACGFAYNGTYTDTIVSDSHLTSSARIRVTLSWYTIDASGNTGFIEEDSPDFYGSTSLSGPDNGYSAYGIADTYIDVYAANGSLMIDTTTDGVDTSTQYLQLVSVTKVEVYY